MGIMFLLCLARKQHKIVSFLRSIGIYLDVFWLSTVNTTGTTEIISLKYRFPSYKNTKSSLKTATKAFIYCYQYIDYILNEEITTVEACACFFLSKDAVGLHFHKKNFYVLGLGGVLALFWIYCL